MGSSRPTSWPLICTLHLQQQLQGGALALPESGPVSQAAWHYIEGKQHHDRSAETPEERKELFVPAFWNKQSTRLHSWPCSCQVLQRLQRWSFLSGICLFPTPRLSTPTQSLVHSFINHTRSPEVGEVWDTTGDAETIGTFPVGQELTRPHMSVRKGAKLMLLSPSARIQPRINFQLCVKHHINHA